MRILYPKKPYIASKDITIAQALRLIRENNGYPLNLINKDKSLFGVLSNGDIAKFLSINTDKSLEATKAEEAANHFPVVAHKNDSLETIELYLKPENIKSIPVIDIDRNIIKVITKEAPSIKIGEYTIDNDCSPYLIAEIGVNHNGDTKEAKYLIENAKKAGCNAVKFQHRSKSLYSLEDINSYDLGTQYILSEIERTYLSIEQLAECCKFAEDIGIAVIITPFDEVALDEITESTITISALKIASCDLTNISLIKKCGETKNPLILSTGMSFEREIIKTSKLLRDLMIAHAFLHCNSTYPNPVEDCNLKYIKRLKKITKTIIGYSSHDGNEIIPISSVAMGAKIIEFHITRSKESLGTDHRASIEVKNLKKLVESCKFVNLSMGKSTPRIPSQGELSNRISLGKSYALKNNNARKFLLKKSLEYNLCLNYMGIEPDEYECSNYKLNKCLGACIKKENQKSFNERMNNFIKKSHFNSPNLLLIDKGRRNDEKSIILIIDFKLYGYGFADLNYQIRNIETIKNIITKVNHSNYANNLVKQFIRKNRLAQIINLDDNA